MHGKRKYVATVLALTVVGVWLGRSTTPVDAQAVVSESAVEARRAAVELSFFEAAGKVATGAIAGAAAGAVTTFFFGTPAVAAGAVAGAVAGGVAGAVTAGWQWAFGPIVVAEAFPTTVLD